MAAIPSPFLPDFASAQKTLAAAPRWSLKANTDQLYISAPLDIEGVTVEGLRLGGTAMESRPDEAVTFQLEYLPAKGHGGPFCRIEWRPLSGHSNKGLGPPEFRFRVQRGSHHHRLDLNWAHSPVGVGRGLVPIAVPIDSDPPDFRGLLEFVGKEFRIGNIGLVPTPTWKPKLL